MAEPKLNARLGLDTKEFDSKLNDAQKGVKGFGNSLKGVASAAAAAFGVRELIKYGAEAIQLAAKAEGIKRAFDNLNSPDLLNNLQKATKNTVADVDLMSAAVRANNFHIALDQLPKYFQFAAQRARDTGESIDYLVDSIVMGIGRKSPLILDNLGISLADINEELKRTPDYATAVGNIISREMEKSGEAANTTMDSIEQLKASMTNLKVAVGDTFNNVLAKPLADAAQSLTDVISGVSDLRKELDLGGANKDIANEIRGNIAMASGTTGGYLANLLFGGGKVGKHEILIEAATPIIKKETAVTPTASGSKALDGTILGEGYWERATMAAVEYNNYIESNGLKIGTSAGAAALPSLSQIDSSQLAGQSDAIEQSTMSMERQLNMINTLDSTFTDMFMNADQGWAGMADAIIQSIKRIAAEMAAKAATWAVMKYVFGMDVGSFSSFGSGSGVNVRSSSGVGSMGSDFELKAFIHGSDLAVTLGRGSTSRYNNT